MRSDVAIRPASRPVRRPITLLSLAGLTLLAAPAAGQTLMTQAEALEAAFPGASSVERRTAYLSEAELERARRLAGQGVEVDQAVVTYYVAHEEGRPVGVAYFDAHRVRTLAEVAMVVVGPGARVERVDILKFMEPPEYRAPDGWIAQLHGRPLDEALSTDGAVRNLTGATLTARALTAAARRVLALHHVIDPLGPARVRSP